LGTRQFRHFKQCFEMILGSPHSTTTTVTFILFRALLDTYPHLRWSLQHPIMDLIYGFGMVNNAIWNGLWRNRYLLILWSLPSAVYEAYSCADKNGSWVFLARCNWFDDLPINVEQPRTDSTQTTPSYGSGTSFEIPASGAREGERIMLLVQMGLECYRENTTRRDGPR
jgi:hypothetical protein